MRQSLNQDWRLTYEDLSVSPQQSFKIFNKQTGWFDVASLPCDIHVPLIENNVIKEPLVGEHCWDSEWTEKKSWWFAKTFDVNLDMLNEERVTLCIESLDCEADIWLNRVHLGHHRSAFYPFLTNIKEMLSLTDNELLIRVTSGLEHVSEQEIAMTEGSLFLIENSGIGKRGDERRSNVRKAQFVYGWDWAPRVATCGIPGEIWLEGTSVAEITGIKAETVALDPVARVRFEVEIKQFHPYETKEGELTLSLFRPDGSLEHAALRKLCLRSGIQYVTFEIPIPHVKLWWPNGMGDQPLYRVKAELKTGKYVSEYPAFQIGIRTIHLNTERLAGNPDEVERQFTFEVNGVPMFCKGANWVPADSIVARVSDDKYTTLLEEAREAHFSMLRVWGGGIYERKIFYDKCDEFGLLIWHDFMFTCGKYPDHLSWFREEVSKEMDYQTRRLRNHPSLALWCGNNENHWGFAEWWKDSRHPHFYGGAFLYNELAPQIVHRNSPAIPYWNSSPYGGTHPNDNAMEDRHHWGEATMSPDMERRITPEVYDEVTSKFVSEYGYIGPSTFSSVAQYVGSETIRTEGRVWSLHTNTFEKDTVIAGIRKHYKANGDLSLETYLLYAGLCQGLMYGYSLESLRRNSHCSGALFWMFNDCWGEVGWSVVDYYLRRKIAYYAVKRAFQPIKLVVRQHAGYVEVTAINETPLPINEKLECGFLSYDGRIRNTDEVNVVIPARSRGIIHRFVLPIAENGVIAVIPESCGNPHGILPAILRQADFRSLLLPEAQVGIQEIVPQQDSILVHIKAETYCHAVHLLVPDDIRLSDQYFDLLPGETRCVAIHSPPYKLPLGEIEVNCVRTST
ncbi:glycoside hydrolase family 2 protein [Paenibacillus ferrarius]|uniref:glycoside hydrolase family 2 protein n=1 Tax=Paenibacillus ferrarius TaxID=1469647 RepID=UPI003D2C4EAC